MAGEGYIPGGIAVGRIVHYVVDGECWAAIITEASRASARVTLTVFHPYGDGSVSGKGDVEFSDQNADGTYHFPEVVP